MWDQSLSKIQQMERMRKNRQRWAELKYYYNEIHLGAFALSLLGQLWLPNKEYTKCQK